MTQIQNMYPNCITLFPEKQGVRSVGALTPESKNQLQNSNPNINKNYLDAKAQYTFRHLTSEI